MTITFTDHTGRRFGDLRVMRLLPRVHGEPPAYECRCLRITRFFRLCNRTRIVRHNNLRRTPACQVCCRHAQQIGTSLPRRHVTAGNYQLVRARFTPHARAQYDELMRRRAGLFFKERAETIEAEAVEVVYLESLAGSCCVGCRQRALESLRAGRPEINAIGRRVHAVVRLPNIGGTADAERTF